MDTSAIFWPWWIGGGAVALMAGIYPLLTGRTLGVSSVYVALLRSLKKEDKFEMTPEELAEMMMAATAEEFGSGDGDSDGDSDSDGDDHSNGFDLSDYEQVDYDPDAAQADSDSLAILTGGEGRGYFLVGMIGGGFIAAQFRGLPIKWSSLGVHFDERYGDNIWFILSVLLVAGILVGFGTRMAGGCTSGHGLTGMACRQPGSLFSTMTFWGVGMSVTWVLVYAQGIIL